MLESTGLERGKERPENCHYWDLTVDDLGKRLVRLISKTGVREQVAVEGVIAFLISFYRRESDLRRQHAEEALCFLQRETKDTFTDEFWERRMNDRYGWSQY